MIFDQGKLITDMSVKQGVKHIIWSSLPEAQKISRGKFEVVLCDEKAKVEKYKSFPFGVLSFLSY